MRALRRLIVGFLAVIGFFVVAFFALGAVFLTVTGAEADKRVAQLLHLRGAKRAVADAGDHPLDARIIGRPQQALDRVAQRHLLADDEPLDAVAGRSFGERLGEIEA